MYTSRRVANAFKMAGFQVNNVLDISHEADGMFDITGTDYHVQVGEFEFQLCQSEFDANGNLIAVRHFNNTTNSVQKCIEVINNG